MSDSDPGPLTFFTTDDLLDEIVSRYDSCVFVGTANRTSEMDDGSVYWRGDAIACAGLCSYATSILFQEMNGRKDEDE